MKDTPLVAPRRHAEDEDEEVMIKANAPSTSTSSGRSRHQSFVAPRSRNRRSLSPRRPGLGGSLHVRRPLPVMSPKRSSSSRRLLPLNNNNSNNDSSHERKQEMIPVVRQPSRRTLMLLERANSAPNLFEKMDKHDAQNAASSATNTATPNKNNNNNDLNNASSHSVSSTGRRRRSNKSISARCPKPCRVSVSPPTSTSPTRSNKSKNRAFRSKSDSTNRPRVTSTATPTGTGTYASRGTTTATSTTSKVRPTLTRDNSIHNARQPRRNSNRWDSQSQQSQDAPITQQSHHSQHSYHTANTHNTHNTHNTRSTQRSKSGDSLPQRPPRNPSPERKNKQDAPTKPPRRTYDSDSDDDATYSDDEDSFCDDNDNRTDNKNKSKNNKPAQPPKTITTTTSTSGTTEKKVDATLLGYTDLEEMDANDDLFVPENKANRNSSFSHKPAKMNQRLSIGSTISVRSNRSAKTLAPNASVMFQSRRASMGNRNLPVRASSFFDARHNARRNNLNNISNANRNSNSNSNSNGPRYRRNKSLDMTLNFVTGTINQNKYRRRHSTQHSQNPNANSSAGTASFNRRGSTGANSTGAPKRMQSFSSVVLGGRNSRSFRLQRTGTDVEDARRKRQQQRRCRSMDMSPAVVKRAPSPPPSPKRQVSAASTDNNSDGEDVNFNCDVSDVMASLARDEDEEISIFTMGSGSTTSNNSGHPGSVASGLSLHSINSRSSHHNNNSRSPNNSMRCHSYRHSPQRGRLPTADPTQKKSSSLSPARRKSSIKKEPNNIADLIENMDNSEDGEYIIFIGNRKDFANVSGGDEDDVYHDDDDDNSTYVSLGAFSLGLGSAGFCSCQSSFKNSGCGNNGSKTSLGYRDLEDMNKGSHDDNDKNGKNCDASNPSLGYRDPDNADRKIEGCMHCSSHSHNHDQHRQNKVENNDDDDSDESEVDSAEEWSSDDDSSHDGDDNNVIRGSNDDAPNVNEAKDGDEMGDKSGRCDDIIASPCDDNGGSREPPNESKRNNDQKPDDDPACDDDGNGDDGVHGPHADAKLKEARRDDQVTEEDGISGDVVACPSVDTVDCTGCSNHTEEGAATAVLTDSSNGDVVDVTTGEEESAFLCAGTTACVDSGASASASAGTNGTCSEISVNVGTAEGAEGDITSKIQVVGDAGGVAASEKLHREGSCRSILGHSLDNSENTEMIPYAA